MSIPRHLFIKISGDRNTASICVEGDWNALYAIIPGTRFDAIRDPLKYIIRRMLNAEYLGVFGGLHVWHHGGRFFIEDISTPAAEWHSVVSMGNDLRHGDKTISVGATVAEMRTAQSTDWYLVKVSTNSDDSKIWQLCLAHFWM